MENHHNGTITDHENSTRKEQGRTSSDYPPKGEELSSNIDNDNKGDKRRERVDFRSGSISLEDENELNQDQSTRNKIQHAISSSESSQLSFRDQANPAKMIIMQDTNNSNADHEGITETVRISRGEENEEDIISEYDSLTTNEIQGEVMNDEEGQQHPLKDNNYGDINVYKALLIESMEGAALNCHKDENKNHNEKECYETDNKNNNARRKIGIGPGAMTVFPSHMNQGPESMPPLPKNLMTAPPPENRAANVEVVPTNFNESRSDLEDNEMLFEELDDDDHSSASSGKDCEGLAVAFPVEEEKDVFKADAVQFDPGAKNANIRSRRRNCLCTFLAAFVIGFTGAGIAVWKIGNRYNDDKLYTSPTREEVLQQYIDSQIFKSTAESLEFVDPSSPYKKALKWMAHSDPLSLTPINATLLQRYILVYFYYATSEEKEWDNCAPPRNITSEGNDVLSKCLHGTNWNDSIEFNSRKAFRWLGGDDECLWQGVVCDIRGQVREIKILGMNMTGHFPVGLKHLPFLTIIDFPLHHLRGKLPPDIENWKHLASIALSSNHFTGTVPSTWTNIRNLKQVDLRVNNIHGNLPANIDRWKDIKELDVGWNRMVGSIADNLWENKGWIRLGLDRNYFTGSIPSAIGNLEKLKSLYLEDNQLVGSLPSEIGQLTNLERIRLGRNKFSGNLPEELYRLNSLFEVRIEDNNFNGSISTSIGRLTDMFIFSANDNDFTGTIPSEFGGFELLHAATFSNNHFFGEVPKGLCERRRQNQQFVRLEADCLENNAFVEIKCECCTMCCDVDGITCI